MKKVGVAVKVFSGAKKERVLPLGADSYELYVREPAQRNLANVRVRELIAREYGVSPASVEIVTGHRSPKKRLRVILGESY